MSWVYMVLIYINQLNFIFLFRPASVVLQPLGDVRQTAAHARTENIKTVVFRNTLPLTGMAIIFQLFICKISWKFTTFPKFELVEKF